MRNQGFRYSHPVTTSHSTVSVGGVVKGVPVNDLATLVGNATGLSTSSGTSHWSHLTTLLIVVLVLLVGRVGNHGGVLLVLVDSPIEDVVVLEGFADKQVAEDLAQVGVIRLVIETQRASVVQVDGELVGESTAEDLGGSSHLLLHDAVILLLLGGRLQSLPGKRATAEVQHDIAQRLHVVTARLLHSQVGVDTGIAGSTGQVLVLTVRDVEVSLRVAVFLRQTEVNHIDLIATLANAHQEVVRLDVTVNEGLGVDVFDPGNELVRQKKHGLQGELAVAKIEQVLQAGSQEIDHHGIVVTLGAKPTHKWNAHTTGKGLVDTGLILQLGMLRLDALELDRDFFAGDDVGT